MDALELFGINVRRYRKMKGLSQEELADLAGLHRTYVGATERGQRNISLNNMARIADSLEVPLYRLLMKDTD
ncbi:MAG: helix-turn-helix domain-containing protein [Caulobacteraceae bacterium]